MSCTGPSDVKAGHTTPLLKLLKVRPWRVRRHTPPNGAVPLVVAESLLTGAGGPWGRAQLLQKWRAQELTKTGKRKQDGRFTRLALAYVARPIGAVVIGLAHLVATCRPCTCLLVANAACRPTKARQRPASGTWTRVPLRPRKSPGSWLLCGHSTCTLEEPRRARRQEYPLHQ